MSRAIILIVFVLTCLSSITAGSDSTSSLVIAHQLDYRPFCHRTASGESEGLLIDWWKLWATKVDTTIIFKAGTIEECLTWIVEGEADAIAGVFVEDLKRDSLIYGELVVRVKTTLFLRKDIEPKSIYDIRDTIGLLHSAASSKIVTDKYPELMLRRYETAQSMLDDINQGLLSGFFYDVPSPVFENASTPELIPDYRTYLDVRDDALRPAMRSDNKVLQNLLQEGGGLISSEEIVQLARTYNLFTGIPSHDNRDNSLIIAFSVVAAVIIGLLALILRRQRTSREGTNWRKIIEGGENDRTEFKSSLRWDYREGKANKALEYVIAKSLSAFMNSDGGRLVIGVDDEGKILGLQKDYASVFKGNADGFLLVLTNLINKHFGKNTHRLISARIVPADGKEICIIEVSRSPDPVFLKKGEQEEFFIRTSAASVPLGMSDSAEYIRKHF